MVTSAKCPKCGLVQLARQTCRSCGAMLPRLPPAHAAPPPHPVPKGASQARGSPPRRKSPAFRPLFTFTVGHARLVVSGLILVAVVWVIMSWPGRAPHTPPFAVSSAEPADDTAAVPGRPIVSTPAALPSTKAASPVHPAPGEPKASLSEADHRLESEAIQAVKAVQADTKVGVTYREYAPRVLDAQITVDRYIRTDGGNGQIKELVRQAMALYVLASSAWEARISKRTEGTLADDPALELCPVVKDKVDKAQASDSVAQAVAREIAVAAGVEALWGCVSERIAEIDGLRLGVARS